ncbi:hypothetical protein DAEQUDRAFT_746366 [Daedalea quercina L-15889]|uniref:Uncharacterized protein n=1 Tax=Daedalea quercina L-15889 TaxID=1314783 RepID=A0A165NGK0_9APHY|nr:hypothetical protein DAEQUDRAFT_746366 [Daedalea quercina L-15889]
MTDVTGAKEDFLASIDLQPSLTQTWVKIASVYMEQGEPKKAFDCFEEAIKHNPDDPDIYYHLLFIMNEFDEAAQNYTKSTQLDDQFVFSHIQLAVAQYKANNLANSMATFRRTLKAFPHRSEPHNYYGELLLDQQRFQEAVEKFDRAIEIENERSKPPPINVLPQVNKGLALYQWKQDIGAAERCCQEALRVDPECEAAVATLAQLSLQQGKIDTAMEMFERQADLARSEPELMNALTYQFVSTVVDLLCVAFYPNMKSANKPQKPFSRSAAKRESVMALGSIEHLQHYFTKSGIAAESNPLNKPNSGMVPAIGGPSALRIRPYSEQVRNFELPPSPAIPQIVQPSFPPYVKTFETDSENLRPGVIEDLSAVAAGWQLDGGLQTVDQDPNLLGAGGKSGDHLDVLDLLKATTRAVRSVRNYLVSLPDDSTTPMLQTYFRPQSLQTLPPPRRRVSQPDAASDQLTRIRRGALEVLAALRDLEETARLPLEHDAYDAQSDHGSTSSPEQSELSTRGASPDFYDGDGDGDTSVSISFIEVGGRRKPVPVWEDDEPARDVSDEEHDKRERWDERLVVGGGWLYRQDMRLADLVDERAVVSRYLDAVDEVLFGGVQGGKRGWTRERERAERKLKEGRRASSIESLRGGDAASRRASRRVVSTGMLDAMRDMVVTEEPEELETLTEEDAIEDDDLPEWAKRSTFADHALGRLHALLVALLPASLLPQLPHAPPDRAALMQALSSGQLLCAAYNAGVRKSRKPWGFVSKDAIHDIVALEAQSQSPGGGGGGQDADRGRRGWTFRRTDNLRLWAAALKLRYLLPITSPAKPPSAPRTPGTATPSNVGTPVASPSPSQVRFLSNSGEEPILFDAPMVARQEGAWEDMLEAAVLKWMDAVVEERRGER